MYAHQLTFKLHDFDVEPTESRELATSESRWKRALWGKTLQYFRLMTSAAAAILLSIVDSAANAQRIKGSVRDAEDRSSVANAFVALMDTSATIVAGVSSDLRGRFDIRVPGGGLFAVVTVKPGYI